MRDLRNAKCYGGNANIISLILAHDVFKLFSYSIFPLMFQNRANQLKRALETRETSRTIVDDVRANINSGISHHLPPKKADRQAINRKRSAMTAFGWKIPKSLQELEIPEELKTLLDGTDFMLYDSGRQQ